MPGPRVFPFVLPLLVVIAVGVSIIGLGLLFSAAGNRGTMGMGLGIIVASGVIGYILTRQ